MASASAHPATAPATVKAARGPRAGIIGVVMFGVEFGRRKPRGRSTGAHANGRTAGERNQPERIAANAVHVRIGHSDGRGGGDHCLDGIAAFAQDLCTGLRGKMMRSRDHALRRFACVQHRRSVSIVPSIVSSFTRAAKAADRRAPSWRETAPRSLVDRI